MDRHSLDSVPVIIGCHSCHRLWEERNELARECARLRELLRAQEVREEDHEDGTRSKVSR